MLPRARITLARSKGTSRRRCSSSVVQHRLAIEAAGESDRRFAQHLRRDAGALVRLLRARTLGGQRYLRLLQRLREGLVVRLVGNLHADPR